VVDPARWAEADLSADDAYKIYRQGTKKPSLDADAFKAKFEKGWRYDPNARRFKKPGGASAAHTEDVADAKSAAKGPSGKNWDDPSLTRDDFISDYRSRYPKSKLTDEQLGQHFDSGKRLAPDTGKLRKPKKVSPSGDQAPVSGAEPVKPKTPSTPEKPAGGDQAHGGGEHGHGGHHHSLGEEVVEGVEAPVRIKHAVHEAGGGHHEGGGEHHEKKGGGKHHEKKGGGEHHEKKGGGEVHHDAADAKEVDGDD